jgi:hypothetical protein
MEKIEISCENTNWDFKCPKNWFDLSESDSKNIRHCSSCNKDVYLCRNHEELSVNSNKGRCVALVLESKKNPSPDYEKLDKPLMGRFASRRHESLNRVEPPATIMNRIKRTLNRF